MKRSKLALVFIVFLTLVVVIGVIVRFVVVPKIGDILPGKQPPCPDVETSHDGDPDQDSIAPGIDPIYSVHFIDVGQGDAIYIETPSKNMLIDGGGKDSGVVEYLMEQAVDTLNILIATHPHADHLGGLPQVLSSFVVMEVIDPGVVHSTLLFSNYLNLIDSLNVELSVGRAGMKRTLHDKAYFEVLHPLYPQENNLNDASIVVMLVLEQIRILLTGDIEKKSESEILARYPYIKSHVLKLAHHGSITSTSEAFLEAASPEVAIIYCGKNNKFGFPHDETLEKLMAYNIHTFRTDRNGSIVMFTDGDKYFMTTESHDDFFLPHASESQSSAVNLNAATMDELTTIIHIGPARARQLIELRPLSSMDELLKIQGIDEKRLEDIKHQNRAFVNQP